MNMNVAKKNRKVVNGWNKKGCLIVIEGIDGAGKSSSIKLLKKYFESKRKKCVVARFNMSYVTISSIKIGKQKFFGPYANTLLHLASIVDQLERWIVHQLEKGHIIIFDRYIYTLIARGIVRGINSSMLFDLEQWVPKPDMVIFLDIPPNIALKRIKKVTYWEAGCDVLNEYNPEKTNEYFEDFQYKIRQVYKQNMLRWNLCIIDADKSQADILKEILYNFDLVGGNENE